ncbi:PREDICTED: probable inactive shikimate kinase like 1, chloroplastic isoform X2 [Ipomoea nil]|uniref:probable inactive shikimate kinase like 1, chloroplastic isoform X2 n=1 Tax=Ipomoea nil TaxID=35883 RepID=UPI000901F5EA|nr:PREDICTED: probable inactive shikimate kinase like 1, chloroplastic isoform X2 [Ipomoea nil]
MEIIRASYGGFNVRLLQPSALTFSKTSLPTCHSPFRRVPATSHSISSLKPTFPCRKPTVCALLDDNDPDSTADVANAADLSFVVKRAFEISPDLKGTCIFLVGINSSIKSNLGKLLADELKYYYFDSDSVVEDAVGGKEAATSFIQSDKEGFQDTETEVLRQLSSMGRLVVSAGNAAVRNATNLALIRHGISIWIKVPLQFVAREVVDDKFQLPASQVPISGSYSEVLAQLTAAYEETQDGYATADATVSLQKVASQLGYDDIESVSTEELCLEVMKEIGKLMRKKKMMEEAARPF